MGATEGFKMYKLIELLTEYNDNKEGERIGFITTVHIDGVPTPYELGKSDLLRWEDKIISKKYGFIKWLVDNEKIDFDKLNYKKYDVDIPTRYYLGTYIRYSFENEILMTLAIQDEPIEFLISLLK